MIEQELCDIWAGVLGVTAQPHDDFFDLGGNSLKVVDVVIAARQRGISVRSSAVFRNPTPARLAESLTVGGVGSVDPPAGIPVPAVLTDSAPAPVSGSTPASVPASAPAAVSAPTPAPTPAPVHGGPALTVLVADGAGEPLFLVLSEQFSDLEREAARGWETGRPVYTLSLEHDPGTNPGASPGVDPGADPAAEPWTATVPELAERFVGELLAVQPAGPYHLAGVGSGAVLAFELARQLRAHAREVGRVVLIKPPALPGSPVDFDLALRRRLALVVKRFGLGGEEDAEQVLALLSREGWYGADTGAADLARLQRVAAGLAWALSRYRPGACDVPVVLLQDEKEADAAELLWGRAAADLRPHWFDYGVEWFGPLLADPRVADVMKAELLT